MERAGLERDAARILGSSFAAPNARALSPRFGPDYVLMLSSKGGADGLWKMGISLRNCGEGPTVGWSRPPAVSPDGTRIAFAYRTQGRAALSVMSANGTDIRMLTDAVDVRGSFSWSPDGQSIVFAGRLQGVHVSSRSAARRFRHH